LTRSTVNTRETLEVDGVEYPLVKLEISRTSHPYYTVKLKWLTLQDVLISSKRNMRNSKNNLRPPFAYLESNPEMGTVLGG